MHPWSLHTCIITCSCFKSFIILLLYISDSYALYLSPGLKSMTFVGLKYVIWWSCITSPYVDMYNIWPIFCFPHFTLNFSSGYDLFTVSWLLIPFIVISIIVDSAELYYIYSSVCDMRLCMYSLCVMLLFVPYQKNIVGSFLFCLSIFWTYIIVCIFILLL